MGKIEKVKRKRVTYTESEMLEAIAKVKSGESMRKVSKEYGIPKTTLFDKRKEAVPTIRRCGPARVLTNDEENMLIEWISHMLKVGFPVTKSQLVTSVKMLVKELKRDNPFTNGRPGRSWLDRFFKRHPDLTHRITQNLTRVSVTETALRGWFAKTKSYLESNELCNIDPSRIFSCYETSFLLCPKGDTVLIKKSERKVHSDEKECLTTLFMANAKGTLCPPVILFAYERIPYSIMSSMPKCWAIGRSKNGCMTGENLYEYVTNVFHPWLISNAVQLPIVLYIDGHCTHVTMLLSKFCSERKIFLVPLYPNSRHILQPLEVSFFEPLKNTWCKEIAKWRVKNDGKRFRKEDFAPLLMKALDTLSIQEIIVDGFQATGLYLFSENAIKYEKVNVTPVSKNEDLTLETFVLPLRETSPIQCNNFVSPVRETSSAQCSNLLEIVEKYIEPSVLVKFKESECCEEWNGNIEDRSLFSVWRAIKTGNAD